MVMIVGLQGFEPAARLTPFDLLERGPLQNRSARAVVANLAREIAERELASIGSRLGWPVTDLSIEQAKGSIGPGNIVILELYFDQFTEVFTGFGERSVAAEEIVDAAAEQCERYLESTAPVGEYLADQLLLPLALSGGGSFRTIAMSLHATTHIQLIRKFLGVRIETTDATEIRDGVTVTVTR